MDVAEVPKAAQFQDDPHSTSFTSPHAAAEYPEQGRRRSVRQRTWEWLTDEEGACRSEGKPARRGVAACPTSRPPDAVELYGLEHRFSVGWALAALGACNIGATVLMLLAQA